MDECIYDVLFEVHKDTKQENSICQICQTRQVFFSFIILDLILMHKLFHYYRCKHYGKSEGHPLLLEEE